jgi:arabinan endo-1,5-alpha-L-arabinosidase
MNPLKRIAIGSFLLAMAPAAALAQVGDVKDVPDPTIIAAGGHYYIFSTEPGIGIRRSDDLYTWRKIGTVLPGALPDWAQKEVPGTQFPWAPDVSFFNGRYHVYYALSTFGGQRSVIGLATNTTLDPASPGYRWVDEGTVVESNPGVSSYNAIDANVSFDERRQPWLSWGSFWGGIKMRRLDLQTGKPSAEDTVTYSLAARAGVNATKGPTDSQAIEGPFIIRRAGYYWLFVSFDACCRGAESSYNVRVGRSAGITGPYMDRAGVAMTEGGGTLVLAGLGQIAGPGHNAVLTVGDRQYIVHHFVNIKEGPASPDAPLAIPRSLQIRPLYWGWDGWPIAGEPITGPQPAPPLDNDPTPGRTGRRGQ